MKVLILFFIFPLNAYAINFGTIHKGKLIYCDNVKIRSHIRFDERKYKDLFTCNWDGRSEMRCEQIKKITAFSKVFISSSGKCSWEGSLNASCADLIKAEEKSGSKCSGPGF